MFIRQRYNKSGSISVQIVQKVGKSLKIIKHIGTSKDQAGVAALKEEAQTFLDKEQLHIFDLKDNSALLNQVLEEIEVIKTYFVGYEEVFGQIYSEIGFDKLTENPLLKDLVIARIAKPTSKLALSRWLKVKQHKDISDDKIYRFMDTLDSEMEQIVTDHTFNFFTKLLKQKINIIFFDATTLHFETFKTDTFRLTGFSKVGKHNQPQIVVGLMVTEEGLPIGYDVYPGNQFDGHTIRSALKRVKRRYNVEDVVFVADASMMIKDNVDMLRQAGFKYIMAAKIKNMPREIEKGILNPINYKDNIFETKYGEDRLIVSFSQDRARKDAQDRENNLKQIKKRLTKMKGKVTKTKVGKIGKSKYLTVHGKAEVSINYQAVRDDQAWDGLKGYVTNIPKKQLSNDGVIQKYVQLWQVEKAFRISKDELKIRPIYHYKKQRIRAHILLVFMGLVVSRYTEYLLKDLGVTTGRLLEYLDSVQVVELGHPKVKSKVLRRPALHEKVQQVYDLLQIKIER